MLKMSYKEIFRITPEESKAIQAANGKSEQEIVEFIKNIKEWLMKQQHLPNDEDAGRLRVLLMFNKYSLEKVKTKLEAYYSLKHLLPDFYCESNPLNPDIKEQMKTVHFFPLPHLNHDLCRVFVARFAPDIFNFDMLLFSRIYFTLIELHFSFDPCLGDQRIYDLANIKFEHIVKMTPTFVKRITTLLRGKNYQFTKAWMKWHGQFLKSYSDRVKGVHFLNIPPGGATIISLVNKLLSAKLANRVHAHENLESLHKYISKDILPSEYGGSYSSREEIYSKWKSFVVSQDSWLLNQAAKRSDESKRIGEPYDRDLCGMYGSFKQINID